MSVVPNPNSSVDVGQKAVDFSLPCDTGRRISLSDFTGKNIVLYFYPKDDTPGCTREAECFKEKFHEFTALGTVILGISKDSVRSHHNFKTRYSLPFDVLSDTDAKIINAYGAWVEKSMFGKKYMGIDRATILLDRSHVIRKIWRKVTVKGHAEEILDTIKNLEAALSEV